MWRRWAITLILGLVGANLFSIGIVLGQSDIGFRFRVAAARARGYDGCACMQCAEHFGFGPPPSQPSETLHLVVGTFAVGTLASSAALRLVLRSGSAAVIISPETSPTAP